MQKNQSSQIIKYIERAQNYLNDRDYESALKQYLNALRLYSQSTSDISCADIYRKIAECYSNCHQKNLTLAKKYLQNGIEYAKKKIKNQKKQQYKNQLHDCLTNLGLIYLDEVDQIQQQSQIQKLFRLLDKSRKYLQQAYTITKRQIKTNYPHISNYWYKNYCSDLLNIVNTYISEGNAFLLEANSNYDQTIYQKIIKILDKAEKFYKIHKNQCSLRDVLSKCYYYKGVSYTFLRKYKQAQIYLIKDKKYCQKHKLKQQFEKNEKQRIKLHILKQEYEQALKIIKNNYINNKILLETLKSYKQLKNEVKNMMQQNFDIVKFRNCMIELFEKLLFVQVLGTCEVLLKRYELKQYYFEFHYNNCKAYQKLKRYKNCLQQIQKANKFCSQQSQNELFLIIIKCNVLMQIDKNNYNLVEQISKKGMRLAEKIKSQTFKIIKQNLQIFRNSLNGANEQISDGEDIFKLFKQISISEDEQIMIEQNNSNTKSKGLKKLISIKTILKGGDYYKQKCVKYNIPVNKYILQNTLKDNKFQNLINFDQKHIKIILKSLAKISVLDFTNHQINQSLIQNLLKNIRKNKIDIKSLQKFIIKSPIKFNLITSLLAQSPYTLQQSSFSHLITIQQFPIQSLPRLKILKLKKCNLNDKNFLLIKLQNLPNLQNLNLSGNFLTQRIFKHLNSLNLLLNFNLSNNPLELKSSQVCLNISLFTLKLKNISLSQNLCRNFLDTIRVCKKLDLSKCKNLDLLIKAIQIRYLQQDFNFKMEIEQFILNRINLTQGMQKSLMKLILPLQRSIQIIKLNFLIIQNNNSQLLKSLVDSIISICVNLKKIELIGYGIDKQLFWENYNQIEFKLR